MKTEKKGNKVFTVILRIIFLIGLGILLYPVISDLWNSHVQSYVMENYETDVATLSEEDYTQCLIDAKEYNERIRKVGSMWAFAHTEGIEGYDETLNLKGNGVIGTVMIPKLDIKLPIYHGTSDTVLAQGAGHMEGSTLPIGGESTHSVIVAHRGLPTSRLFTNLDEMEIGDYFKITVLDEELWYEVDQILTVLPDEMESLYIEDGKDLCTLLTCTPYGINTHRLLVRGHRTEAPTEEELEASFFNWRMAVLIGMAILVLAVIIFVCVYRYRKNRR